MSSESATQDDPEQSATGGAIKRPAPRGTAFYPRKRAVAACQVCRARRTKCDNLKPSCSFCLKTGATCIQSPVDLSAFDQASLKILERLDDVEGLIRSIYTTHGLTEPGITQQSADGIRAVTLGPQSPATVLTALTETPHRIDYIVDNFFRFVHVKNPILDEIATRRMVPWTFMKCIDWSPTSCLSLLICALGFIATPFGPSENTKPETGEYSNAQACFQAAEKRMGGLIGSDDITSAQCLFLAGVYHMCIFQPFKAWRYFVQALASCQGFPFLRDNSDSGTARGCHNDTSAQLATLQQAIYWSAWKSEREVRGDVHLPDFRLSEQDRGFYPSFFPTPPAHRETPSSYDNSQPGAIHEQTAWYFYLAEISLRRLSSRVYKEILALHKEHPTGEFLAHMALAVPEYEAQLQEWTRSLPLPLSFDAPASEDDVCRFVLRGHALNFNELVYWSFGNAILDGELWFTVQNRPQGAYIIQLAERALCAHARRIEVNRPGFRHRHHGTWPMIRTCTRSALVLTGCALTLQRRQPRGNRPVIPHRWQELVTEVVDLLMYWERERAELREKRFVLEWALNMARESQPSASMEEQGGFRL
ncbi:hypothetical protein K469DRAFT_739037 [Zopfia rhizophila CBS 207.26]|uniref:Zn(2)-C6 fungal-type domain-containing protein n=1 Tax=Zopfia rhizophila CBS 207.26 TaxID=1314779 RepID=A0A6A6E634_9PEZI|nr:hypothetical protein K469DRAFT_739037 [Zopfia rhizophila CBS 207.26]